MNYKHSLILFCKSFRGDIDRAQVLWESIKKFNIDDIPFYFCIPRADKMIFRERLGEGSYIIVLDEDVTSTVSTQSHFTQQVFKMEFYNTGISEFFFLADSDMYFIRPFTREDFITKTGIPYMTLHECKDLLEYSHVIFKDNRIKEWFNAERLDIMKFFGREGKPYDYSGSANLYSSEVFRGLYENVCKPKNLSFADLLKMKGGENTWYGEYALASGYHFYPCAPMFKTFHYPWQYDHSKKLGITESMIADNYLGITMQGNWHLQFPSRKAPLHYTDDISLSYN